MILENESFKQLEYLPHSIDTTQGEMHLKVLDFVKGRITDIKLADYIVNNRAPYRTIQNELQQFPNLKNLSVQVPKNIFQAQHLTSYLEFFTAKKK